MNEQTTQLIRELAEKLGTTTEHLWGVLVRQAPISSAIDAVTSIVFALLIVKLFRFVSKKTTETDDAGADWTDEGAFFAWGGWTIFSAIGVFCIADSIPEIAAGFFNPEYWALKQIIK